MKKVLLSLSLLSSMLLSGLAQADVARAIVTTGVAEREPINDLSTVLAGNKRVLFFTELRDMEGQQVKHRWNHGGEVMAEVAFNVGGARWRVWSSKNLIPGWAGEWSVEVVDAEGNVIANKDFVFESDDMADTEMSIDKAAGDMADAEVSADKATSDMADAEASAEKAASDMAGDMAGAEASADKAAGEATGDMPMQ